ncbi:beta-galactosidase [Cohnella sp. OV330]|uniref:beta-galactosidase n=1 Tax=Cohnella sp. OV330 TaxID=1855288 RepID=UPI0008E4AA8D|nr:alpha-amylase family protein [Cohnella sp. OV330]SFB27223.1 beta-galactosidase [Cohnella sp. OV330]
MKLATAYYPDYHPQAEWSRDFRLMREAGIECIRIAEFAWAKMEPEEGVYDWEWLDDSIRAAEAHGLSVILCTPTATPPIWLTERYPDVLPVGKNGRTIVHGARQQRCYSSDHYKHYSLRIVEEMGKRYGADPAVIGWQIDNEFGGETKYDYGDVSKKGFQAYLEAEFGDINALNERWGTAFWSQTYRRFDQIQLPAPIDCDVMMWPHPSLELAFRRFSSKVMTDFHRSQVETLRRYTKAPITTNAFMFNWGDNVDWAKLFDCSDVVGIDIYSSDEAEIAFYADACRSLLNRPFWVMEYGTGSAALPAEMDLMRSRGCEWFSLFKFRVFPWGQEQETAKGAMLAVTGDPLPGYGAVKRWADVRDVSPPPPRAQDSGIGVYYDFECAWTYEISKADPVDYFKYVHRTVYAGVYSKTSTVSVLFEPAAVSGVRTLLLPLQILHDDALEEALIAFVQGGGHLVATSDLFRRNRDNVYLSRVPAIFREVLGWQDSRFMDDVPELMASPIPVLAERAYGRGRMTIVRRDLDLEGWASLAKAGVQA